MTTFAFSSLSMFILWAGCFINENDDLCLLLFIHIYSVSMLQYQQWKLRPLSFPLYPYLLCEHAVVPTMKMTTFAFFSLSIFTLSASCCTNNENDDICLFLLVHTYSMRLLFLNKMFKSRIQFLSWMVMVEYLRVRGVCHSIRHPNDRAALLSVK